MGTTENRGVHPPTGSLACLRQKFRHSCLSTEASDLMLASWRTKSSQTYDSLFNKWVGWCSERHHDPLSAPIADVANFLAYLFKEGYKSRFLNSFRSAISSVHDPVDGVEVGKHPTISRLLKGAYHSRPPPSKVHHNMECTSGATIFGWVGSFRFLIVDLPKVVS